MMANISADKNVALRILELCNELKALRYGDFTLTSGEKSSYYFDGRLLTLSPGGSNAVAQAMLPAIRESGAEAVGGPAVAAVPMVTEITMLSAQDGGRPVPAFFVRPQPKEHGMGKLIEGPLPEGVPVAIIDDACSTAGSLYLAIRAAEETGHKVVFVGCILDRNQGGSNLLRGDGYELFSILKGDASGNVAIS
jgi:orotate phosphoribosyltransferase